MRKLLIEIHLWFGLTLGLLWAIQGITGSLLVSHREIDQFFHGELSNASMAPSPDLSILQARG